MCMTQIPAYCETLCIICHVETCVDFSSMITSLDPWPFTFQCEMNLDDLCHSNQWEILSCNGWGPSVHDKMWTQCVNRPWASQYSRVFFYLKYKICEFPWNGPCWLPTYRLLCMSFLWVLFSPLLLNDLQKLATWFFCRSSSSSRLLARA